MSLNLLYITNDPAIALIAERYGVDRIMVDLETLGKEERQKNMNTVKSKHTITDVYTISKVLTKAELLVRINPWNENSVAEIESVIAAGAKRIMLPMWKSSWETDAFLNAVGGRVATTLLLETCEAVDCLDAVLKNPLVQEVHIGLNDLHLSYGMTFMFELLSNGTVESLCRRLANAGVRYGFGGIARIGEGTLPAERIVMEHYRLGSSVAILSRSFCNCEDVCDAEEVRRIFSENMANLRAYEKTLLNVNEEEYKENTREIERCVKRIVENLKEKRKHG